MLPINNVNCEQNEAKPCVYRSKTLPLKNENSTIVYEKTFIYSFTPPCRHHIGKAGEDTHIPVLRVLGTGDGYHL